MSSKPKNTSAAATPLDEANKNVERTRLRLELASKPVEVAKAQDAYQRALVHRDRLLGAFNTTMDEKRVVKHPKFVAALDAIFGALREHPRALADVTAALKALDTETIEVPADG